MSLFNQPQAPNPQQGIQLGSQVAGQQQDINTQVAQQQQAINAQVAQQQQGYNVGAQAGSQYNQADPYGTLSYTQTGVGPNGVPIYSASTQYSQPEQNLFNTLVGTQQTAGTGASNLLAGANYGSTDPTTAIGNMTSGLTGQMLGSEVASLQPYFNIQTSNLTNQLANQGITPESNPVAYNNAMLPVLTGQNTTVSNFLANQEPQAFQQATTEYQMPMTMAESLGQFGQPQSPSSMFTQNTPSLQAAQISPTTVSPTNLTQAVGTEQTALNQQYQAQQAQYNAMLGGLFGVGSAALKGLTSGGTGSILGSALGLAAV